VTDDNPTSVSSLGATAILSVCVCHSVSRVSAPTRRTSRRIRGRGQSAALASMRTVEEQRSRKISVVVVVDDSGAWDARSKVSRDAHLSSGQ